MLWLAYLIGLIVLVVIVLRIDDGLKIPPLKKCLTLTGASLMNLGGIAAILGYVFFKERRGKVQVSGVVLVLVGAFVLHLKTWNVAHKKAALEGRLFHCIKPTLTT